MRWHDGIQADEWTDCPLEVPTPDVEVNDDREVREVVTPGGLAIGFKTVKKTHVWAADEDVVNLDDAR